MESRFVLGEIYELKAKGIVYLSIGQQLWQAATATEGTLKYSGKQDNSNKL